MLTRDIHHDWAQADREQPPYPRFPMSRAAGTVPFDPEGPVGVGKPDSPGLEGYGGRDVTDATTWLRGPHIQSAGMTGRLDEDQQEAGQ